MNLGRSLPPLAGVAIFALGACSSANDPREVPTVQLHADYPTYDTQGLVDEAVLIVEGTVLATEPTVLLPRYEGDTPEENPLLGLSEEEMKRAMEQDSGVAATAVTFRVDVVHQGTAQPGEQVTIIQTGGVVDGVNYVVEGETSLDTGESYLLFAAEGLAGTFAILGGSAGTFIESRDGVFVAPEPEIAPTRQLTTSQMESLTGTD